MKVVSSVHILRALVSIMVRTVSYTHLDVYKRQVYKGVDPQLSLDMLMRLQTKTPDETVSVRNWPMYIIRWGSMAKQKKLMKVI